MVLIRCFSSLGTGARCARRKECRSTVGILLEPSAALCRTLPGLAGRVPWKARLSLSHERQGELHGCAPAVGSGPGVDRAALGLDDAADDEQPQPDTASRPATASRSAAPRSTGSVRT